MGRTRSTLVVMSSAGFIVNVTIVARLPLGDVAMLIVLLSSCPALQASRVGFGRLARNPLAGHFERLERLRVLDVNHRVELIRRADMEVVALSFSRRQIDHADRAAQSDHVQRRAGGAVG